jgi:hypothetical protein
MVVCGAAKNALIKDDFGFTNKKPGRLGFGWLILSYHEPAIIAPLKGHISTKFLAKK